MSRRSSFNHMEFNATLARVARDHAGVQRGLDVLTSIAPRPIDSMGAGLATRGAKRAVAAATCFLSDVTDQTRACETDVAALEGAVQAELERTGTVENVPPRGRQLRRFPAWSLCITLADEAIGPAALVVGGLMLLMAHHKGRPVPSAMAKSLMVHARTLDLAPDALRELLDSRIDVQDTDWPWLSPVQRQWPAILNALCTDGGGPPPTPSFNWRARGQIFGKAHFGSPQRRAGVPTRKDLSEGQFRHACAQVSVWLEADHWRGGYAVLTASSGLTVDLVREIKLLTECTEPTVIALDVERGTLLSDLGFLAPEAAAPPKNGTAVPAGYWLEKPLPLKLAADIRARMKKHPTAICLADLYPEAELAEGHMAMIESSHDIPISWARWISSVGLYARLAGLDHFLTAVATSDFSHAPRSKLYYAVMQRSEVWKACAAVYSLIGAGAPGPDAAPGIAFGCRVVPTEAALQRALNWLRAQAQALRPARRDRNLSKLLEFHNRYTRTIAFELCLLLALRETRGIELNASLDEELDLWIEVSDKVVPGPKGALPVCLCRRARQLIAQYRVHCRALGDRLLSLGHCKSALYGWTQQVETGSDAPLLMMAAGLDALRPAGTADFIGALPAELAVAPDAGRKWLENALRLVGVRTGDIDAVLRHDTLGQSRYTAVSDFVVHEWAERVGAAIDTLAARTLGSPMAGLARR